jgi:hypothetical protein
MSLKEQVSDLKADNERLKRVVKHVTEMYEEILSAIERNLNPGGMSCSGSPLDYAPLSVLREIEWSLWFALDDEVARLKKEAETWYVELETGVFLSDTDGDPGRTLQKYSAQLFDTRCDAEKALEAARKFRPFRFAVVHPKIEVE